jgi:calcineurin-like phosphoesterase family protein
MMPKMRRWILSDSHLGHSAIQAHCRRPANVDEIFTKACKRLIGPDDVVIHDGDVCFNFFDLKAWFADMPGKWILVRGNHDSHSLSWYMNNGFTFACDALVMSGCYFTHRPASVLPEGCTVNVHGHMHNRVPADYRKFPFSRLFALEHSKYEPMLLEKFLRKGCPGGEVLPKQEEQ